MGLVIHSKKLIAGIVFIHGHESSFNDITRALDEYQIEVDQDGEKSSGPHHTLHHFLKLNARLGVEWFHVDEFIYPQGGNEPPTFCDRAEFKEHYFK